jgi:choline dehydrogenase-like flavoprotein
MIRQLGDGPLQETWDLCVIGAGAAGLAIAMQFLHTSWKVIVLESGLHDPDATSDDLNTLNSVGLPHHGWRAGRVRSFGGTTRAWGGQLVPMRSSELAERPWVPNSGWPLEASDLEPHYRRVENLLGTQGPPYDATVWERVGVKPPEFAPTDFCIRFSQWAALGRRNFAVQWRRQLEAAGNILVLLDATAVAVRCSPAGERCESIDVRSRHGSQSLIRARTFIIACGGIETARLLLASDLPNGGGTVANRSGLVGRFFQDHVSYIAGEVEPASRRAVQYLFDPRYVGSTMFSAKLEPTDGAMSRHSWLNAMGHIAFQIPDALGWMELRRILRSIQAGRLELPSLDESRALLKGGLELSRLLLTRILARRRRSPGSGAILLLVDTEQAPNPDSRIVLDECRDALGMRRARLDWRVTDLEYRTLTQFAARIAAEFARLGLGRIRLAGPPDFTRRDLPGAARDIFHHMGTTRMSRAPEAGVTRADLRCHDVDNLYIAGCSVFPAGGIANPTFTALALGLRLADQLKSMRAAA